MNCFRKFQQCYDEVERPYDEVFVKEKKLSRDDWAHGSLLVINELLRCSNMEGEVSLLVINELLRCSNMEGEVSLFSD